MLVNWQSKAFEKKENSREGEGPGERLDRRPGGVENADGSVTFLNPGWNMKD